MVFLSPSDHSWMSNSVGYRVGYSTHQRARIISLVQVDYYVSTCLLSSVLCFCIFCSFGWGKTKVLKEDFLVACWTLCSAGRIRESYDSGVIITVLALRIGHKKAYSGTLTRNLRLCSNFLISPLLALTRIISHKLAQSRHCQVDTNFNISSYSQCNFTITP